MIWLAIFAGILIGFSIGALAGSKFERTMQEWDEWERQGGGIL